MASGTFMLAHVPGFIVRIYREQVPWILLAISGAVFLIVGVTGELLGWWNDLGVLIIALGLPQLLLGAALTVILGAGRTQVRVIGHDVRHVRDEVRRVGEDVRQVGEDVRQVGQEVRGTRHEHGGRLDAIIALLTDIRDRLPPR